MTEKLADPEYHYIDAFRVIRAAGKSDAAKAKAVAQFVADEIAAALRTPAPGDEGVETIEASVRKAMELCGDNDHALGIWKALRPAWIALTRLRTRTAPADEVEAVARLRAHLREQIEHVETRIQDGIEMGATVWRLALEDVARENRAALSPSEDTGHG